MPVWSKSRIRMDGVHNMADLLEEKGCGIPGAMVSY
jgi:hypothetical protein